jgi:Zn-dependent protease
MPFRHIDFVGAISLIFFGLGWAKPMAIDSQFFRFSSVGIIVTILTGFVGLLVTAILLSKLILPALTMLPFTVGLATAALLRHASSLSIWFALFSLIPIPPLTGGLLVSTIGIRIPKYTQWILTALVFVAVATGVVHQLLNPAYLALTSLILDK